MPHRAAFPIVVTLLIATVCASPNVSAAPITLAESTNGALSGSFAPGESVTTPAGGPWDQIAFNWFTATGLLPTAVGTLFLLDQQYGGTAGALSNLTSGFIAQSTSIAGGVYLFDPSVELQPLTQYFFYTNTAVEHSGTNDGSYAGGNLFGDFGEGFTTFPAADANFRLTGTEVVAAPVPEPASLMLLGLGLAGIAARRRRQRKMS